MPHVQSETGSAERFEIRQVAESTDLAVDQIHSGHADLQSEEDQRFSLFPPITKYEPLPRRRELPGRSPPEKADKFEPTQRGKKTHEETGHESLQAVERSEEEKRG